MTEGASPAINTQLAPPSAEDSGMKRTILPIILVAAVGCAGTSRTARQPRSATPGPWLWRVRVGKKVSHLFMIPPNQVRPAEIPPVVWKTLAASKSYYAPYSRFSAAASKLVVLPEGTSLESLIGKDDYAKLQQQGVLLFPPNRLAKSPPFPVALRLLMPNAATTLVATELMKRARAAKLRLDYVVDRAAAMAFGTKAYNARFLHETLDQLPRMRRLAAAGQHAYERGTLAAARRAAHALDPFVDDRAALHGLYGRLYDSATTKLDRAFRRGGAFVAVDWRPLIRKHGLLARLRARGIHIERVTSNQPPTVTSHRDWNTLTECTRMTTRVHDLLPLRHDPAIRRQQLATVLNTCLAYSRHRYVTCMNEAVDGKDAVECYRLAWLRMAKRTGISTSGLDKHSFYKRIYGPGYELNGKTEELAEQACECTDKWCASEVSEDLFTLIERLGKAKLAGKRMDAFRAAIKKLTKCVLAQGVDRTWFLNRIDEAAGN